MPLLPKTPNRLKGSWWKYHAERVKWRNAVAAICKSPPEPVKVPCEVVITTHRARLLDPDNAVAAVKPILDALRRVGWLHDDREEYISLSVAQVKDLDKSNWRTIIQWVEKNSGFSLDAGRLVE